MSGLKEEVAQLTGSLKFNVDLAGLKRFENMMRNASRTLAAFTRQFEALSKQMAKTLKLRIDTTAADKAKQKLDAATKRQARAEAALSNQQRKTFTAELQQQKLKYAGTKAQAQLNSAALQSQKDAAIVAAKASASHAKNQGISKAQLASQNALTASLTRQAKLEAILAKTRAATQRASQQHLATQTNLQRIQQQMNHAQQVAHHRAQQQQAKMAAAQQTAQNKAQNASQSAARFQMAQKRHAAWQARQNAPAPSSGMFGSGIGGVMAVGGAIGGIGLAVAGLERLVNSLNERITQRKQNVIDAERFEGAFTGLGKSPEIRKFWKDTFIQLSNDSGAEISNETSEDFRTFVGMQQAFGKNTDQIIKEYKLRQQAFAVAGLTKDSSREVNRQLNQVSTDGLGDKSDWNVISERVPMLVPYVTRAFGEEEKITDPVKAVAAFNKRMKKGGGVKMDWITKGMETMIAENQSIFDQKKQSVGFSKTLQENQEFLNATGINNTKELNSVMRDNINAHRELNAAMQPLRETIKSFDQGLTEAQTSLIRFAIGRNQDGSEKSSDQKMQDAMTSGLSRLAPLEMVGTHDYSKIDTKTQHQGGWIGNLWNWVFGVNNNSKLDPDNQAPGLLGSLPAMKLDTSKLLTNMPNYTALASNLPDFQSAATGFKAMQDQILSNSGMPTTNQTVNAPINLNLSIGDTTINGATDTDDIMSRIDARHDELVYKMPGLAQKAVLDVFGQARAQQAERQ
ncbi:hypothetical protein [Pseudomonas sp. NPDC012596]|uniref:hypothetical protein n=1 Tax=Pseudomonas sp. NPDC012596 TaxID=3364419 RepID=UPI0036938AD6